MTVLLEYMTALSSFVSRHWLIQDPFTKGFPGTLGKSLAMPLYCMLN